MKDNPNGSKTISYDEFNELDILLEKKPIAAEDQVLKRVEI